MNTKKLPMDNFLKYKRRSGAVKLPIEESNEKLKEDESLSPKLKPKVIKWSIKNWILSNIAKNNQEKQSDVEEKHQQVADEEPTDDIFECECSSISSESFQSSNKDERSSQIDKKLIDFMDKKSKEWSNYSKNLVDTHCHFDMMFWKLNYNKGINEYFKEYKKLYLDNISAMITVICNPLTYDTRETFKKNYSDLLDHSKIYASIGCHPHFANKWNDRLEEVINARITHRKIVALGECGLDASSKNRVSSNQQIIAFKAQLKIAKDTGLPIVIHCRDAEQEVFDLMTSILNDDHKIHLHCFTGPWNLAQKYLSHFENLCIGITPLVTQTQCKNVNELARNIPLDRLLFETDAPYFKPRDYNFPSNNLNVSHPGFVFTVAEKISKLRNISINNLLEINRKNVKQVYGF